MCVKEHGQTIKRSSWPNMTMTLMDGSFTISFHAHKSTCMRPSINYMHAVSFLTIWRLVSMHESNLHASN